MEESPDGNFIARKETNKILLTYSPKDDALGIENDNSVKDRRSPMDEENGSPEYSVNNPFDDDQSYEDSIDALVENAAKIPNTLTYLLCNNDQKSNRNIFSPSKPARNKDRKSNRKSEVNSPFEGVVRTTGCETESSAILTDSKELRFCEIYANSSSVESTNLQSRSAKKFKNVRCDTGDKLTDSFYNGLPAALDNISVSEDNPNPSIEQSDRLHCDTPPMYNTTHFSQCRDSSNYSPASSRSDASRLENCTPFYSQCDRDSKYSFDPFDVSSNQSQPRPSKWSKSDCDSKLSFEDSGRESSEEKILVLEEKCLTLEQDLHLEKKAGEFARTQFKQTEDRLAKDNKLLRSQLGKYISAVKLLKKQKPVDRNDDENSLEFLQKLAKSSDLEEGGILESGKLLPPPPPKFEDYLEEAKAYESKLVQVSGQLFISIYYLTFML